MNGATDALRRFFGFEEFLDHQKMVIDRILNGEDLCVVMPTGAGKSLCYQLPVLMKPGYALVVSPLIALMYDQVMALRKRGIPAAFINSSITFNEQIAAADAAARGEVKLLYVAPERLQTEFFSRLSAILRRRCWWSMRRIVSANGDMISGRVTGVSGMLPPTAASVRSALLLLRQLRRYAMI